METASSIEYVSLDEIVFETRNRRYGAYLLRKAYHQHLGMSLLIATALCFLLINLPSLFNREVEKVVRAKPLVKPDQEVLTDKPPIEIQPRERRPVRQVRASTPNVIPQATIEEVPTEEKQPERSSSSGVVGPQEVDGDDLNFDVGVPEGFGEAPVEIKVDKKIYDYVGQMPEFPGGDAALIQFLSKHIRYPQVAQRTGVEGKVFLQFVVARDGSITDVQVVKGISKECDEEAVRVVKAMPAWKPGKQNGMPVAVRFTFPVFFKMSE